MKYYSEKLKKFFDTEDGCIAAEKEAECKKALEKSRLEEVHKAENEYYEKLSSFLEDYGYYTSKIVDDNADDDFLKFIFR